MELIFNELSMNPPVANKFQAILKMQQFAQTVAAARKKGFKRIRSYCALHEITLAEQYSAQDWIHDKTVSREMKDFLPGMIVRPFIKEDDEAVEAQYVEADYYFEKPENSCYGMAAAYLYDTVLISLAFSPIWEQHELELSVRKATILKPDFYMVKNIAAKTDFEVPIIADFVEQLGNIHNGFRIWDCGLRNPLIINPFRNPQSQIHNPLCILPFWNQN